MLAESAGTTKKRVGKPLTASTVATQPEPRPQPSGAESGIYISSDESDSGDSSFAESSDEGDDDPTPYPAPNPPVSMLGCKQVTPPKLKLTRSATAAAAAAAAAADKSSEAQQQEQQQQQPPGWEPPEVSYFYLLRPLFGHNYCAIAEVMESKSCEEVFAYSKTWSPRLAHSARSYRAAGKKKKKNMRCVCVCVCVCVQAWASFLHVPYIYIVPLCL